MKRGRHAARSLTRREWRTLSLMAGAIVLLHALGFTMLIALVAAHHYRLAAGGAFTIGIGVTAYTLGLRHAFDADHISAIDNTARKLMSEGKRPLSVGFWFSLGHSSIVFALSLLISVGVRSLDGPVRDTSSNLHRATSEIRGRLTRAVTRPAQMYPVGLLFGLGFDTATEVALIVLAGGAAGAGLPWYAILCLPILFAAGMALADTIDGSFMNFAYDWAFSKPVRKVFYNLTVTGLSVMVAVVVGTIELGGLVASELNLSGSFWSWLENINLNFLGYVIVALFVLTWVLALLIWRVGRIEERWDAPIPSSDPIPS